METQPLAYMSEEFLTSDEARPVRLLAEYLEPLRRFRKAKIRDTVVFFGSARTRSREAAERHLAEVKAGLDVNGMAADLLTVRLSFEPQDLAAGREEFACHRTQYTPDEMDAVNAYLAHAWDGQVWLRPWNGAMRNRGALPAR